MSTSVGVPFWSEAQILERPILFIKKKKKNRGKKKGGGKKNASVPPVCLCPACVSKGVSRPGSLHGPENSRSIASTPGKQPVLPRESNRFCPGKADHLCDQQKGPKPKAYPPIRGRFPEVQKWLEKPRVIPQPWPGVFVADGCGGQNRSRGSHFGWDW